MQLTSKFILLALALAYGGTAVSAIQARESSVEARSFEYEDLNAREIDDMELFVRDPFSLFGGKFGFGTPSHTPGTDDSHSSAGLSVSPFVTLRNLNCLIYCFLAIEDNIRWKNLSWGIWPTRDRSRVAEEVEGQRQRCTLRSQANYGRCFTQKIPETCWSR